MLDKFSDKELLDIFTNHDLTVTKVTIYKWRKSLANPTSEQYAWMTRFIPDDIEYIEAPIIFAPIPRA